MRGDGLILFDGVCVLCSRGCRFVSRRDRNKYFRYVPMQSPEGRTIAASLGIDPDHPNTFAYIADGTASQKSDAAIRILRELPGWGWTSALRFIPRLIRDAVRPRCAQSLSLVRPLRQLCAAERGRHLAERLTRQCRLLPCFRNDPLFQFDRRIALGMACLLAGAAILSGQARQRWKISSVRSRLSARVWPGASTTI
jgi:predicted DCC family thiol-disulfide oxidoreductase YuxK